MQFITEASENPKVQNVVEILRGLYVNGGVTFATFTHRSMEEYNNAQGELCAFLDSPDVRRTLHFLKIPDGLSPLPQHSLVSPSTLQSDITCMLKRGGAYTRGVEHEAETLAAAFCGILLGDRNGIQLFRIEGAWSPWFYDVAWDYTCVMKIPSQKRWVILCCTDTD